jgi:hypothetical protein
MSLSAKLGLAFLASEVLLTRLRQSCSIFALLRRDETARQAITNT